MMNKDKVIKDLKERNDKLKNQYQLQEIRLHSLEYENEKVHKDFDELSERYFFTKSRNEKAIEYIENNLQQYKDNLPIIAIDYETLLDILKGDNK